MDLIQYTKQFSLMQDFTKDRYVDLKKKYEDLIETGMTHQEVIDHLKREQKRKNLYNSGITLGFWTKFTADMARKKPTDKNERIVHNINKAISGIGGAVTSGATAINAKASKEALKRLDKDKR